MKDFEYINKELGTDYTFICAADWNNISSNYKLSEKFIETFKDKVDWTNISCYQKLSEKFIEKHQNEVNWLEISKYQALSESFIEKFKDKVNWNIISILQKLSESFIEEHSNEVSWYNISTYQILSEPFIERFRYKVNWINISCYQKLSDEFIEKHCLTVDKENLWQYQSEEFKKEKLIKTGKYECHENYFIAYKAIRNDRYSLFNFQYQYLPCETYESNCDCTNIENSFGLNVGTYDFVKEYLGNDKGFIIKCKVYYKDIGRIVKNGNNIRCFRITVLE